MGESPRPSAQCDFEAGAPAGDSPGGCGGRDSSYRPWLFWGFEKRQPRRVRR